MDREQGSSYLERPGHALRPSTPRTTLTVLVSPSSAIFPGSGVLEALHPDTTNSTDSSSQSVKRKASSMLRTVLHHIVGRFWSLQGQWLPRPGHYEESQATLVLSHTQSHPHGEGEAQF